MGYDVRVQWVRDDEVVGRGTGSWIDEMTRAELVAWLDKRGATDALQAVMVAREAHRAWVDRPR